MSAVLAVVLCAGSAQAKVLRSPDSLAPPNAPAHWLPPEPWVYNHWLPYDEQRLYRLLRITRSDLWQQVRDDRRTVAQLAARRGWKDPRALAAALVAPRRAALGSAATARLEDRALRTLTQGHLAQHVFFHSLHQFSLPSAAPELFGVTDAAFRRLRRSELSPLAIGRLHGRSPGYVEGQAIAVLRERVRAGVRGGAMSAAQAAILLRRQLTQLPRWLDQQRYNGPPSTHEGALVAKPRDYASNPAISADGRFVAYEAYRQKLPLAVKLGEIAVLRADLEGGATTLVSGVRAAGANGPQPASAYNATISGDGTLVSYESAEGNQNFAKRYGRIGVLLCDLSHAARSSVAIDAGDASTPDSQSSYNPQLAAGGTRLVFQAIRDGRTAIVARDLPGGSEQIVSGGGPPSAGAYADAYEAGVSRDGTRVVFTAAAGRLGDPGSATSKVVVRDLRTPAAAPVLASRADGAGGAPADGHSADGAISPDGRWVAFTSDAANLGGPPGRIRLYLRDLDGGRTQRIATGDGLPLDPVVSDGGRTVAFTLVDGAHAEVRAWSAATGGLALVSRATGAAGTAGDGWSDDPSITADGRRVAFASTASNLDPRKPSTARGVFVRDLTSLATRLVSDPAAAYAVGS